ncbi:MAG: LacI family transcriptional regulator, partial [Lachnospiraceae bacterium]|nr:LacI family transcriptional regulator [Lachnospiraceae bacterium]
YAATMLQRQYDMGYLGVKSVLDCIDGLELSCKFQDTGVVVVNRDMLSDEDVQQIIKYNE